MKFCGSSGCLHDQQQMFLSSGNIHNRAASFLKGAMQIGFDLNEFSQTCCLTDSVTHGGRKFNL